MVIITLFTLFIIMNFVDIVQCWAYCIQWLCFSPYIFGFPWINTLPHLAIGFAYSISNISPSNLERKKKAPNNNSNTPAHVWPPASGEQSEGRGRGRYSLIDFPLSSCLRMASFTLHRAWQLGLLQVNLFRDRSMPPALCGRHCQSSSCKAVSSVLLSQLPAFHFLSSF